MDLPILIFHINNDPILCGLCVWLQSLDNVLGLIHSVLELSFLLWLNNISLNGYTTFCLPKTDRQLPGTNGVHHILQGHWWARDCGDMGWRLFKFGLFTYLFIYFWQYWGVNSETCTLGEVCCHLSHSFSSFCFSYFSNRPSHFGAGSASDLNPPVSASIVARITDAHHYTQLVLIHRVLLILCQGWSPKAVFLSLLPN
jgi:hypothetical protein